MDTLLRARSLPRLVVALLVAAVALVGVAPLAAASSPIDMGGKRVVDESGILSTEEMNSVEQGVSGTSLYAVYVDSFDGLDTTQWCTRTAEESRLDSHAVLFVVATEDRKYDLCAGESVALNDQQRKQVGAAARDRLKDDDWAGAAIAAAQTLDEQVTGASSSPTSSFNALSVPFILVCGAFLIVVLVIVVKLIKRPTRRQTSEGQASSTTSALDLSTVMAEVVAADDSVRTAREDLDYAAVQLGQERAGQFEQALRTAESHRDRGLDALAKARDTGGQERQEHLREARAEASAAVSAIAAQQDAFAQARDTQERAGEGIAAARRLATDYSDKLAAAREELARLHTDFATTTFTSLDDNPDRAERLIASARDVLEEAGRAWEGGDRQNAQMRLVIAERALHQAGVQIDQVFSARETLGDVNRALLREIAALGSDLDDAARLAAGSQALKPLVDEARAAIEAAQAARATGGDPLAAIERLVEANAAIDEVLDPLRDEDVQRSRAAARVKDRISEVTATVCHTQDYITAYRGQVGVIARERARQAVAALDSARTHVEADPQQAESELRTAASLARQARSIAEQDVEARGERWSSSDSQGGMDIGTLMIGGILGSMFGEGGHGGGPHLGGLGGGGGFSGGFSGGGFSGGGFSGGFGGGSF